MIPLAIPDLTGNESKYLQACIETTFVSSVGPFVTQFEQMVAASSGSLGAVATSSGTTGLHAALVTAGVGRDDLVILPSFTFIGSANAIAQCGASPWLLDIDAATWTLDPQKLKESLQSQTTRVENRLIHRSSGKRIGAIMPVHVLGIPADMNAIVNLAAEYALPVVADGAAALGSEYRGRKIGDTGAQLTVFSFNGNKTVTAGGGGAIVSNDRALLDLARHLTTTARVGADYDHDRVGFNYRLTNVQAAVGCAQMERLEEFVSAKRRIQSAYNEGLAGIKGISFFPDPSYGKSACWFSGFVAGTSAREQSTRIREKLREKGVDARPFWKPMHFQKPFANAPRGDLHNTESIWDKIVTLPCSTSLSTEDQGRVIACVREILV